MRPHAVTRWLLYSRRPEPLPAAGMANDVFDTELTYLKGMGPRRAEALAGTGMHSFRDLLFYFPAMALDGLPAIREYSLRRNKSPTTAAHMPRFRWKKHTSTLPSRPRIAACV